VNYLLNVPLESSDPLVIEISDGQLTGVMPSARPGEIVATANQSLNSALARLQPMIQAIAQATVAKLRDSAECPDDFGVEFGVKMAVDAGLVVAHTSGEANFKVTMQWRRPRTP
jgi:hypothetical protein